MNKIHPTAIIGDNVIIGDNNEIGAYSIIEGNTTIGDNNFISSHTVIGCPATDSKHIISDTNEGVRIGNNNIIREFCVIEQPCYEKSTIIGNDTFLMQGVHVSHDLLVDDKVVITNTSVLGGIAKLLEGANIAMACTINQYSVIGQYSIAATNSAVMKNIRPFSRYIPSKPISVNLYAIKKYGFMDYLQEIEDYVLQGIPPTNNRIKMIVEIFDEWVAKYGGKTY